MGTSPRSAEGTPKLSRQSTPASPMSPSLRPQKVKKPANKTVSAVRKLTELHHLLPLELPLAPKELDGATGCGKTDKNARKNEKRRNRKKSGDADEDPGASSDSSGWAIALG